MNTDKKQLEDLYKIMYQAMIHKDRKVLESIHDDSFVLIHMTGLHQNKQVYIDSIMNGTLNYYSEITDNLDINVKEGIMIGQSRVLAAVFGSGENTWPLQLRFDVIRKNNEWKLLKAIASMY